MNNNFVFQKVNELFSLLVYGANLFAPFSSSISRACVRFACVRVDSRNILNFLNLFVYNANCIYLCRNCEYMSEKIKWFLIGVLLAVLSMPFWLPYVVAVLAFVKFCS